MRGRQAQECSAPRRPSATEAVNQDLRADVGRDRVVPGVERRAESGQTGDRHDGDQGGDEPVLDRGRTGAILCEAANEMEHGHSPFSLARTTMTGPSLMESEYLPHGRALTLYLQEMRGASEIRRPSLCTPPTIG